MDHFGGVHSTWLLFFEVANIPPAFLLLLIPWEYNLQRIVKVIASLYVVPKSPYRYRYFWNCLIDIDIDIDIFKNDHIDIDIDIDIFQKCRYIDNRYVISIYRTGLASVVDVLLATMADSFCHCFHSSVSGTLDVVVTGRRCGCLREVVTRHGKGHVKMPCDER